MSFFLETQRLILRDVQPKDVQGMFELDSNPLVHKYLGNKPISHLSEAKMYVDSIISQYKKYGIGRFAVIHKINGDFMGWSGIKFNTGDNETIGEKRDFCDIGYRFIPKYWGNGYAKESAITALDFGFKTLKLDVMCGAADVNNVASNKILTHIGLQLKEQFEYENEQINWYELKRNDYAKTVS